MAGRDSGSAPRRRIKLVFSGDAMVGKTCLSYTYEHGSFPCNNEHRTPNIFAPNSVNVTLDGCDISLDIWQTAGQEDYERLRPLSYPGTDVFLLCYAINDIISFNNITEKWAPELRKHCPRARIVLVATKADCRAGADPATCVERACGRRLAVKLKADGFVECSACTGEGVREAFETAARSVLNGPQLEGDGDGHGDGDACRCRIL